MSGGETTKSIVSFASIETQRLGSIAADDEPDAYLAESTRVAELVGIPPDCVPSSRAAMREYFGRRPAWPKVPFRHDRRRLRSDPP